MNISEKYYFNLLLHLDIQERDIHSEATPNRCDGEKEPVWCVWVPGAKHRNSLSIWQNGITRYGNIHVSEPYKFSVSMP